MSTDELRPDEGVWEGDALVSASLSLERALCLGPWLRGEPRLRR